MGEGLVYWTAMAKSAPQEHSLALYRKYRPQNFHEVRGQDDVVSVLEAAVKDQKKLAHAYLFAGSRGTGKTSMARILARALEVSDKDVYEIDAASNRQVDDARELREGVATLPFESKYKFYILDEVHMLTKEAFNTLLKTLEEPPEHAIFVLATTEMEKVPETIVSRCQVFQFRKPAHAILKSLALDVAKKEGAKLSPAGAEIIALMGDGSFRDTLGILQKVLTVSADTTLSEEEVAKVVGAPSSALVNDFLSALSKRDTDGAIEAFHKALKGGAEAKTFALLAIAKVRGVLLTRFAPKAAKDLEDDFGPEGAAFLKDLAGKEGAAINAALLAELITAFLEMNRAPLPALPLELALYRALGESSQK
jgi:DNA polymerase-3 subunit gamma/tau